jgi:hypothetical protein
MNMDMNIDAVPADFLDPEPEFRPSFLPVTYKCLNN